MNNKVLALGAVVLALAAVPAYAVDGEGGPKGPQHGKKMGYMFDKLDTNSDGVVSEDEFLVRAKERFKAMDANSDGSVTKEEAQAFYKKKHEEMREKREKMKEMKGKGAPVSEEETSGGEE